MTKLGEVSFEPLKSSSQYTAYNLPDGSDLFTIEAIRKAFNISIGDRIHTMCEGLDPEEVQRAFLLTGAYGTFPPITVPKVDTVTWLIKECDSFKEKTDIATVRDFVCESIPDVSPGEATDHESMYRVVNFLTCIRHEVMGAYLNKRQVPWNPLVSFTSPFYYRKGYMRNWVMDNNILRAEILEFIFEVYHFLVAAGVIRKHYMRFYLRDLTQEDVDRLKLFDYIKDERVMQTICSAVSKMRDSLTLFDRMLRRIPEEPNTEKVMEDNLLESLQGMFKKLKCMEQYCASVV